MWPNDFGQMQNICRSCSTVAGSSSDHTKIDQLEFFQLDSLIMQCIHTDRFVCYVLLDCFTNTIWKWHLVHYFRLRYVTNFKTVLKDLQKDKANFGIQLKAYSQLACTRNACLSKVRLMRYLRPDSTNIPNVKVS